MIGGEPTVSSGNFHQGKQFDLNNKALGETV